MYCGDFIDGAHETVYGDVKTDEKGNMFIENYNADGSYAIYIVDPTTIKQV